MQADALSFTANLPSDWEMVSIADACRLVTDGSHFSPKPQKRGAPIANVKDLRSGHVDIDTCTRILEEEFAALVRNGCDVQTHDVLLSKDGTIGRVVVYRQPDRLVALSSIAILRPSDSTDPAYLGQVLQSSLAQQQFEMRAGGSALRRLVLRDIKRILIPLPPGSTQVAISKVLATVDEAIAAAESVITKLQRVRHGFLHNLLTRGIDENGELRDATRQPEKFMNSLLGLIPRGWGVASLGQFLTSAEYGISTSLSTEGVLPVLRMNNLANGEASISDLKYATFEVPARLILRDGDVLFNRTNSFEHVGRTGIWRGQIQRATFASYLVRLNPVPTRLTSEFLNLVLNSREVQRRMRRFATPAVQQVNISPSSLQRMHIAVPERIEEQEQIAARALSMRDSVDSHTRELHKLRSLRAGLMSDLLQGRVRVPEDLKIEATA